MNYTEQEVIQYVNEDDIKFIRIAFCDSTGTSKNISIMPSSLKQVFENGIQIDGSAVNKNYKKNDSLYLFPDPSTISLLPWRPDHGKVARMYSSIKEKDGSISPYDKRSALLDLVPKDDESIITTEAEFVLYITNEYGAKTDLTYDNGGYLDIAPTDKCENIRRSICLTLESMGINIKSSCHSYNPGQNRIVYSSKGFLSSADDLATLRTVVATMASSYGLYSDNYTYSLSINENEEALGFQKNTNPYEAHIELINLLRR